MIAYKTIHINYETTIIRVDIVYVEKVRVYYMINNNTQPKKFHSTKINKLLECMRFLVFTLLFTLFSKKKSKRHTVFTLFKTVSPIQERNYDFELNAFRYYIILSQFEMIGMQIIANNLSIVGVMLGS